MSSSIILGDALIELKKLSDESVDAVITDPPFGIGFQYEKKESIDNPEDYWKFLNPIYLEIQRVLKRGGFFAMWQSYKYFKHFWSWFGDDIHIFISAKNFTQLTKNPINIGYDPIIIKYKKGEYLKPKKQNSSRNIFYSDTALYITQKSKIESNHPCPRPIDVCRHLIENFVVEGGLVLDPFAGSGTILKAAEELQRRYYGIELNQKYFEIIKNRLGKQMNLLMCATEEKEGISK